VPDYPKHARNQYYQQPNPGIRNRNGRELQSCWIGTLESQFISKLGIVVEEADETVFWLELLSDSGIIPASKLRELKAEGNELVAIFLASRKRAKS
jgi:hypothetical protein